MSKTYFVRIRGRVQGPFPVDKLRTLVRRGQVGRTHEVSEDAVSWTRAADFAELFEAPTQVAVSEPFPTATQQTSSGQPSETIGVNDALQTAGSDDTWFYAVGSAQTGPVNRATLQHLLRMGQLPPDTEVWFAGMENWAPADTIPGLAPPTQSKKQQEQSRLKKKPTGDTVYNANRLAPLLRSTRVWAMLIASVGLVLCLMQLIRGTILIAANQGIWGLGLVTFTIIQGAAVALLLTFATRIGKFLDDRSESRLIAAMQAMRAFWMYVGILLSVLLALLLVAISLIMAGVDLAANPQLWTH